MALAVACSPRVAPVSVDDGRLERRGDGRRPVILVPGVTGSQLRDAGGRTLFGTARPFFLPRDGGYRLARSLTEPEPPLEAFDVIREVRVPGLFRKPIYQPILDLLQGAGYRAGDIDAPEAGATLYRFAYDWRQDNVDTARRLSERVAAVRRAAGDRRVDLVCQSNGAHVCRWAARFAGADLETAAEGAARPLAGLGRVVLVGASNGGSLRILREMNRGRRYVPVAGRRFLPEIFFTMPSLFVDLPWSGVDLFVDAGGRPLEVDLWDPAAWERYGWSIFSPAAASRADRAPTIFGRHGDRRRVLAEQLARARRFQQLLESAASPPAAAAYHLVENASRPTPARAVLVERDGRWHTHFTGDRWLRRRPALERLAAAAGDGHSTISSQRRLAPVELALLAPPRRVTGGHFEMLLEAETRRYLLETLSTPLQSDGPSTASTPPSQKRASHSASRSGASSIGRWPIPSRVTKAPCGMAQTARRAPSAAISVSSLPHTPSVGTVSDASRIPPCGSS